MSFWIEIEKPYGTKKVGPIRTAKHWQNIKRLDRAGEFSFEMPAADSKIEIFRDLDARYYARCYTIRNGEVHEQGCGIIEEIRYDSGAESWHVRGSDLMGELAGISVGDLKIYTTDGRDSAFIQYYDGTLEDFIGVGAAHDGNTSTGVTVPMDDEDALYVGDSPVFDIVVVDIGTTANADAGSLNAYYWDGSDWAATAIASDETQSDVGASFAQDGKIRIERRQDWALTNVADSTAYFVKLVPREDLDDVSLREVTVIQELPTSTALADIFNVAAVASAGWTLDTAYHSKTETDVYMQFAGESVLAALIRVAEHTGEHFRLGEGRKIQWLQDDEIESSVWATNHGDPVGIEG